MRKRMTTLGAAGAAFLILFLQLGIASTAYAESYFTMKNGELVRPTGYREWIYVGTPVTPNDMNNGKAAFPEHHNVYIDPNSWKVWKQTGEFREGTIIMLSLIHI